MKYLLRFLLFLFLVAVLAFIWFFYIRTTEQVYIDTPTISTKLETGQTADFNENRNAYFGDLHVHTSWSFDAFIFNVRTTPDDAYRFGKGEAIPHVGGKSIQLGRPLDFMAVTDHAEYMGIMMQMLDKDNPMAKLEIAKMINNPDGAVSGKAFSKIGLSLATSQPYEELIQPDIIQHTWQRIVQAADRHYEPGKFTTFPAYEWTSVPISYASIKPIGQTMHRNVIFKGGKVTGLPFSAFHSQDPEDLWAWMEKERVKGVEVMAIPHNTNMSNGQAFDLKTRVGETLTVNYAQRRSINEPITEVVQIKGQSMVHPTLAPNDEFANFELYAFSPSTGGKLVPSQPKHSYAREALKNGIALEKSLGTNPFKFGLIGSSDGHNAASAVEEHNFFGKIGVVDGTPKTRLTPQERRNPRHRSAAGLAGVWAKENTRSAIFDAMQRKETFATSGPRIKLRFFAGWNLGVDSLSGEEWVTKAYQNGVPMGSDLVGSRQVEVGSAPNFLIQAVKDSESANLDRIQVIKGYFDQAGMPQETIYEVSWAGERKIDADGKLPAIGNTVDVAAATYSNDIGAVSLQTIWTDPDFDIGQSAFYYLRVLEIPTPRWTTYDAKTLGVAPLTDVPATIQERAWSSPIWYQLR